MQPEIRKIVTYDEEVLIEGFKPSDKPWRMFAVAAVITNPWTGRFVEDLKPEIHAFGPVLGEMMTKRMIALAGSSDAIEAYGKAAVVGLNGESASGLPWPVAWAWFSAGWKRSSASWSNALV